jgi:hypothetical protein
MPDEPVSYCGWTPTSYANHMAMHRVMECAPLLKNKGVGGVAAQVLMVLAMHAGKIEPTCWLDFDTLAEESGWSRRACVEAIAKLEAAGAIQITGTHRSGANIYRLRIFEPHWFAGFFCRIPPFGDMPMEGFATFLSNTENAEFDAAGGKILGCEIETWFKPEMLPLYRRMLELIELAQRRAVEAGTTSPPSAFAAWVAERNFIWSDGQRTAGAETHEFPFAAWLAGVDDWDAVERARASRK